MRILKKKAKDEKGNIRKQFLRIYSNKINFSEDIIIKGVTLLYEESKLIFDIIDSYLTEKKKINYIKNKAFSPEELIGKYKLDIKNDILYIHIYESFPSLDIYNIDPINGELIDKSIKYF